MGNFEPINKIIPKAVNSLDDYTVDTVNRNNKSISTVNSNDSTISTDNCITDIDVKKQSGIQPLIQENDDSRNNGNVYFEIGKQFDKIAANTLNTPEGVGIFIAEKLHDQKSLFYWQLVAKENYSRRTKLLEIISVVKDYEQRGKIRTTPAAFCVYLLKLNKLKTKFKKGE